jgi:hypothetical protein
MKSTTAILTSLLLAATGAEAKLLSPGLRAVF